MLAWGGVLGLFVFAFLQVGGVRKEGRENEAWGGGGGAVRRG